MLMLPKEIFTTKVITPSGNGGASGRAPAPAQRA